ncbi:MAG: transglutaminase-like domain-containing protein [Planctomycetota bacterium]
MKYRPLLVLMALVGLLCLTDIAAQPRPWQERPNQAGSQAISKNLVELVLSYDFTLSGETSKIKFLVMLPRTIADRQKILGTKYSSRPSRLFRKNGNRYAEFVFDEPKKQFRVEINIKAELYRYDLSTARNKLQKRLSKGRGFDDFLEEEDYIEKNDPRIRQIAESMAGKNEIEVVEKIYNYVHDNMDYEVPGEKALGAVKAAEGGKGDCSEYSDLFVAICRAKGIAARVVTGYTVRFDKISPKHHWAEVYLRGYGWVPFEASWGDMPNPLMRKRMFSTMKPAYIYLTHIRSDEVLRNSHFYTFQYWGVKPELKDSIEFKQPAELSDKGR